MIGRLVVGRSSGGVAYGSICMPDIVSISSCNPEQNKLAYIISKRAQHSVGVPRSPFTILRYYFVFSAKLDGVKTYMRMRRVPNHLQVKVIKWFDYLWLTQKCSDEERAVSCLPDKLKVNNPPKNVADGYTDVLPSLVSPLSLYHSLPPLTTRIVHFCIMLSFLLLLLLSPFVPNSFAKQLFVSVAVAVSVSVVASVSQALFLCISCRLK